MVDLSKERTVRANLKYFCDYTHVFEDIEKKLLRQNCYTSMDVGPPELGEPTLRGLATGLQGTRDLPPSYGVPCATPNPSAGPRHKAGDDTCVRRCDRRDIVPSSVAV